MKAVIQRVKSARVNINNRTISKIGIGLLIFLGIEKNDTERDAKDLCHKILNLRIMSDKKDKLNLSILEIRGEILVVSQFTLCGDVSRGRRPSFVNAADNFVAEKLYEMFVKEMTKSNLVVKTGRFGENMQVFLINDGPVTFILD